MYMACQLTVGYEFSYHSKPRGVRTHLDASRAILDEPVTDFVAVTLKDVQVNHGTYVWFDLVL